MVEKNISEYFCENGHLKQRKFEHFKMKTMTLSFYLLNILKFDLKEIEDGLK